MTKPAMGRRDLRIGRKYITFVPTGAVRARGLRQYVRNGRLWSGPPADASRLFVGLNVGDEPIWKMNDVMEVVSAERMRQTGDPSASFIAQKGIFKHSAGAVVEEDSVQVIIFNLDDEVTKDMFEEQMIQLASRLAHVLQQELVIVEMQHAGRADKTIGVGP